MYHLPILKISCQYTYFAIISSTFWNTFDLEAQYLSNVRRELLLIIVIKELRRRLLFPKLGHLACAALPVMRNETYSYPIRSVVEPMS